MVVDQTDSGLLEGLTSIDNSYELLDAPRSTAIIRAKSNWIARLAIATTLMNRDQHVVVASDEICWTRLQYGRVPVDMLAFLC